MMTSYRPVPPAPASIGETPLDRYLSHVFAARRCFVCGRFGWCSDREPEIEIALAERDTRRLMAREASAAADQLPLPFLLEHQAQPAREVRPC